jgi:hypothetical protein
MYGDDAESSGSPFVAQRHVIPKEVAREFPLCQYLAGIGGLSKIGRLGHTFL